ncbi:serine hydrolase domain-containing protein [Brevundimonas sp. NPDC058933]|uniref:serine hydrolase domain-containing protein n=1 Tax=Brevundimonas sp. NPDC058933 TaxID=3346673 RepID=UPI003BEEFF36
MVKLASAPVFSLTAVIAFSAALAVSAGMASATIAASPLPTVRQVDAYVEIGMKDLHVPGAAVALFSQGKVTDVRGLGHAQEGAPVTPQTPFQLGSVSKSFTALIVLQLADEGLLSLDDPISKHLPSFRTRDKAGSDLITIRHLLNHRSGLSTLDGNRSQSTTYRGPDAMGRASARLSSATLQSTAGKQFAYSNANYTLLAHLIETVDRRSFEEAVEARIFSRLGMRNSFVQTPKPGSSRPAVGHTQWFGHTVERDFVAGRMMAGPGGVTRLARSRGAVADQLARLIAWHTGAECGRDGPG